MCRAFATAITSPTHGMAEIISKRKRHWLLGALLVACLSGCSQHSAFVDKSNQAKEADRQLLKQVSYEEVIKPETERAECGTPAPFALDTDSANVSYWDLTLD